jgi:hypothetical protein
MDLMFGTLISSILSDVEYIQPPFFGTRNLAYLLICRVSMPLCMEHAKIARLPSASFCVCKVCILSNDALASRTKGPCLVSACRTLGAWSSFSRSLQHPGKGRGSTFELDRNLLDPRTHGDLTILSFCTKSPSLPASWPRTHHGLLRVYGDLAFITHSLIHLGFYMLP